MTDVLGIDPSLTSIGYAFVEDGVLTGGGTIKSTGKKDDDLATRRARLNGALFQNIRETVYVFDPDLVVIESPSYGSKFGSQHDRSGLWWLVVDWLFDMEIPVATVTPQGRAKYGTGKGNAPKDEVLATVVKRYEAPPDFAITGNDVADAVLLASMGSRHLGYPVESSLPAANLAAMNGVAWPS